MTSEETRNLELSKCYEDLYNSDVERFVRECYSEDYVVHCMGLFSYRGHDKFVDVERTVLKAAPNRKMQVKHRHAVGNVVMVEAVMVDPDHGPAWELPFVAALVCKDGKIAEDRTYADWKQWPGLAAPI